MFQYRTSGQWGQIAHHGNRDNDWSMEQSGFDYPSNVMHRQSANDDTTIELTFLVGTNDITAGPITGSGAAAARYFSATSTVGGTVSTTGTNSTISAGSKVLYVGGSDVNEFSNHHIGEIVYNARSVSDTERNSIVAYLRANSGSSLRRS